jgi:mannose-6-phosphate isomerase-like protein (cupin superfamily)
VEISRAELRTDESGRATTIVHRDEDVMIVWNVYGPGSGQELHEHDGSQQVYVVIDGGGEMTVADESRQVAKGDVIVIPKQTAHGITNDGAEDLAYLCVTTPPL